MWWEEEVPRGPMLGSYLDRRGLLRVHPGRVPPDSSSSTRALWLPRDSNPDCADLESAASAGWAREPVIPGAGPQVGPAPRETERPRP